MAAFAWRGSLALVVGLIAGCEGAKDVALSKPVADNPNATAPVPPEDGPRLYPKTPDVSVVERPTDDAPEIGALRFGASVARAKEPFRKTEKCPAGFFPVRPRGYVCGDPARVSLEAGIPLAAPDLEQALPARYGTVRAAAPLYARVPTPDEQAQNEPDLAKHLARVGKSAQKGLRMGAPDVPLDDRGVPVGPPVVSRAGLGVGEDGKRSPSSWFALGDDGPPMARTDRLSEALVVRVLRRGSGVGIVSTLVAPGPEGDRRFGVTPDGALIPVDRLEPALGTTFHGVDLAEKGLPLAFVLRHETCPYALEGGDAERLEDDEVDRRSVVHLSGKFRTVGSVRYEEGIDGRWWRDRDLVKVIKRSKFPDFVAEGTRWIDVSLALQTMTLYEGKKAIYATLISSGRDVLGDPSTSAATVQGTFDIEKKALFRSLDPREVGDTHDVLDAPWAIEFAPGVAFVGSYTSDASGEARGFHDIALSPIDAHRLFAWAGPEVPAGFAWIAPLDDEQVVVHVRK